MVCTIHSAVLPLFLLSHRNFLVRGEKTLECSPRISYTFQDKLPHVKISEERVAPTDTSWTRRIRDPIHGLIVFGDSGNPDRDETDQIAWNLLNTCEFQRLRRIRQLGFSDLIFPGATHSRFAHSIGVYHTARRLADIIARHRDGGPDPVRERIALLAALLHDVGHGPFSHAFEAVSKALRRPKTHEQWGIEIITGETEIGDILRSIDNKLPSKIAAVLRSEHPQDIYDTIVSSQFDADRLDYIQRDRMGTGVEFGHIDQDWIFDSLRVRSIIIDEDRSETSPRHIRAQCLYLGPKGMPVAEEYLEARFRLYNSVYMHKTTRSAEKMLEQLLKISYHRVDDMKKSFPNLPIVRYFASETPNLSTYLALDDTSIWSTFTALSEDSDNEVATLSARIRDRQLYKCVDIAGRNIDDENLFRRFQHGVDQSNLDWKNDVLYDESSVVAYKWYDFDSPSALKKVLVKPLSSDKEPRDIATISRIIPELQRMARIQRAYVSDEVRAEELERIADAS